MNKLLVTGANGLLGSNLILEAQKYFLVWITDLNTSKWWNSKNLVDLDITHRYKVFQTIKSIKPNVIVHCAALTNVDYCEEHPDEATQVNVEGTRNIAIASSKINAKLIYISTDSVFDGKKGNYSEIDGPSPLNVYAKTKLLGEKVVKEETDNYLITRTNMYGWNMLEKDSLAEWIINNLKSGKKIKGFINVIFSPLLVNELSKIIFELEGKKIKGIYHVGAHDQLTKHEFAKYLAEQFRLNQNDIEPIAYNSDNLKAIRPLNTSLNVSKIEDVFGRPMPSVISGIKKFYKLWTSGYVKSLKSGEFQSRS